MTTYTNPLRDPQDRRLPRIAGPCGMVLFGVTGDLSRKKVMPAIYDLANRGLLPPGFSLVNANSRNALAGVDNNLGLALAHDPPVCTQGYQGTKRRSPSVTSDAKANTSARCTAARGSGVSVRGAQNAPRRAGAAYRAPVVASYDPETGKLTWGGKVDSGLASPGTSAPQTLGEESWKWLFLQPLITPRD